MRRLIRLFIIVMLAAALMSFFMIFVLSEKQSGTGTKLITDVSAFISMPQFGQNGYLSFSVVSDTEVRTIIACTVILYIVAIYILIHLVIMRITTNRKIKELLHIDSLTGCKSFRKFLNDGEALIEKQTDFRYSLLYIDVDNFKYINDFYGYQFGDKVLLNIADILKSEVRQQEIISRIPADKFLLLIRTQSKDELILRIERLLSQLGTYTEGETVCRYVVRMGVYILENGEKDINLAMDSANYARGEIKSGHKNTFVFYDDNIRDRIKTEKKIEAEMEWALREGQFVPFFQPKVDMHSGRVVGAEALVRWNHPERGLIFPSEFIPIFEKNGFIDEIDSYIFERACSNIKKRMRSGKKVVPVACNFSRRHFLSQGFAKNLLVTANKYEVPTSLLELEITESVVMERPEEVYECMHQLKGMGFRIAIDDFGTGYSSLSLLKKLPADILKLDRSFLDGCMQDMSCSIIKSVVDIASTLGMQVVCEGVETNEQTELLKKAGCAIAQGYYYHKPLPLANYEALID